jgi:hypothetical protein
MGDNVPRERSDQTLRRKEEKRNVFLRKRNE